MLYPPSHPPPPLRSSVMCTLFNSGCEFQSKFVFASLALHNAKTFVSFICFIKKKQWFEPTRERLFYWPNSLVCTDIYQCGVRRDAELCRLCYKQTNKTSDNCVFSKADLRAISLFLLCVEGRGDGGQNLENKNLHSSFIR